MATFSASSFSPASFSTNAGGAHPSGGYAGSGDDYFFRPVKLGRDRVEADDERKLVEAVAERVVEGSKLDWTGGQPAFGRDARIDWAALDRLKAQSERLKQGMVLEAIRRVVEAVRRAEAEAEARADELFAEELLASHDGELGEIVQSLLGQISRYNELQALVPPPVPQAPVVEDLPPEPPAETAESALVGILRDMVRLVASRKEVILDANGRPAGVRSVFADIDLPPDLGGALLTIRGELDRAMSPREVVRDDSFRIVGLKTVN